ncbi:YchJ family protein [Corynebacterium glutamicum]|uniref:YchJ family protein n=1 Tax=Corynebacterium glutamicum TaxID=1718 RepID=UPI001C6E3B12|nr:YchJ family protein [Corynebacterium glutamicum]QYR16299.1 YchJ family protein [Corynebacterium glutamicum]
MDFELGKRCPCGTGLTYGECCYRFHSGEWVAPTAEALMRSRFTAFAVGNSQYLLDTWDPETRPSELGLDMGIDFYRLDILETTDGGPFDSTGTVKFQAFYKGLASGVQEEDSTFRKVNGAWVYSTGDVG